MFRATMCLSSVETTVFMRHLLLVILYGWNSTLHARQSSTQNNKYQVSHRYSCFSWWWVQSRPKHVEKRNKHTKKYCASSWLYLQDYTVIRGPGQLSRYSDCLRAGRSGDRIPVGARFTVPVQTGREAHPASCTVGTGSFPGVRCGRGVTLTPHPRLVPSSKIK
jgi:hypothetical protein